MTDNPDIRFAWIVFVDLVDSSAFADVLGVEDHFKHVLQPYHKMAEEVFEELQKGYLPLQVPKLAPFSYYKSIRGDEIIGVFACNPAPQHSALTERQLLMWFAIRLGLRIKMRWLTDRFNADRIKSQRSQLDVAIGIHCGPLVWQVQTKFTESREYEVVGVSSPEGFALAYAKRVEAAARLVGDSRFALSPEAAKEASTLGLPQETLKRINVDAMKGLSGITHVFALGNNDEPHLKAAATHIEKASDKGASARTLFSNAVDGFHKQERKWEAFPKDGENEGAVNSEVSAAAIKRIPLLASVEPLVKPDEWDDRVLPNATPLRKVMDGFYATPEALRPQAAIDAFYELDRNGDWNAGLSRPFDWLRRTSSRPYWVNDLWSLATSAFYSEESASGCKPESLRSYKTPKFEPYQAARMTLRLSSVCNNADDLKRWASNLTAYCQDSEQTGMGSFGAIAVKCVVAAITARLRGPKFCAHKDLSPERIQQVLEDAERKELDLAKGDLENPAAFSSHWHNWSRPLEGMHAFAAWIGWICGWSDWSREQMRKALEVYAGTYEIQKRRVLDFPTYRYTEQNFEKDRGWLSCPVASRREIDWWTGDLIRMHELLPKWKERFAIA